jgi:hypothetical protein
MAPAAVEWASVLSPESACYVIKEALVADASEGWLSNDGHLLEKRRLLNRALVGLGIEAVAIGIALLANAG